MVSATFTKAQFYANESLFLRRQDIAFIQQTQYHFLESYWKTLKKDTKMYRNNIRSLQGDKFLIVYMYMHVAARKYI